MNVSFCAAFNISYTTLLSHNCLYVWPRVVSAPIQRFTALSVQLRGDYVAHTDHLSISEQPVACQWLQLFLVFAITTVFFPPAQWKDCLKVDPVEAQPKVVKETGCFHITQDIPLIFVFLFWDLPL